MIQSTKTHKSRTRCKVVR